MTPIPCGDRARPHAPRRSTRRDPGRSVVSPSSFPLSSSFLLVCRSECSAESARGLCYPVGRGGPELAERRLEVRVRHSGAAGPPSLSLGLSLVESVPLGGVERPSLGARAGVPVELA